MPIEKRWVVKPQGNPEAVAAMAAATGISPVLANLLVQRGIDTLEKAKKFFNPQLSDLHDPFLMKDMTRRSNGWSGPSATVRRSWCTATTTSMARPPSRWFINFCAR